MASFTQNYLQSPALQSALSKYTYTLQHLREGYFLSNLTPDGTVINSNNKNTTKSRQRRAYGNIYHSSNRNIFFRQSNVIVSPLLLLALVDPLFSTVESQTMQNFICGIAMLIVDIITAVQIYHLAKNVLFASSSASSSLKTTTDRDSSNSGIEENMYHTAIEWEQSLERKMSPKLRPHKAWISGIDFGSEVAANTNTSTTQTNPSTATTEMRKEILNINDIPSLCSIFYYCNPISILTNGCGVGSMQGLYPLLLVSALREITTPVRDPSTKAKTNEITQKKN